MAAASLPESVSTFLTELYTHLISSNVDEMRTAYLDTFRSLSDRFYRSGWPAADVVSPVVEGDEVFLAFYTCLTASHTFSTLGGGSELPPAALYRSSWASYTRLFDLVLASSADLPTGLPAEWAFDLVSEYVYQCQNVAQFRLSVEEGWTELGDDWGVSSVMRTLNGVVRVSNVRAVLAGEEGARAPSALHTALGFYALVGLSRLHTLVGDYYSAVAVVEHVSPDAPASAAFLAAGSARVHWGFHVGLGLLMLRRYADAQKVLADMVFHVNRNKQFLARTQQYDVVVKWADKLTALLAMAVALSPAQRTCEPAASLLRDRYADKVAAMKRGDADGEAHFAELFRYACPRFVDPAAGGSTDEASEFQLQLFMRQVRAARPQPVRSYLALYPSVTVDKLAEFEGVGAADITSQLVATRVAALQLQRPEVGGLLDAELRADAADDLHFVVADGVISVDRATRPVDYRAYFVDQIKQCTGLAGEVRALSASG